MSLTAYFRRKVKVKLPQCEYTNSGHQCPLDAQYDFVDSDGHWRYGCTKHWMENRATKQLGPGHAKHLTAGQQPPQRPPDYTPPPIDPHRLAQPQSSPTLSEYVQKQGRPGTPAGASPRQPREPRAPRQRAPREFQDMEPTGMDIKEPRPGSVLAITLELIKAQDGATLEEIQNAIGPKHDALKLLQWANEN